MQTAENPEAFVVERLLTGICILILHCNSELNCPIVAALDDPTDLEAWTSIRVLVVPNRRSSQEMSIVQKPVDKDPTPNRTLLEKVDQRINTEVVSRTEMPNKPKGC